MALNRILVLDGNRDAAQALREVCQLQQGPATKVEVAASLADANSFLLREAFDLVLMEVAMPDGDGPHFLERLLGLPDRPVVVVVTEGGTIEGAVSCIRAGAFDYVTKPFSASRIEVLLRKVDAFWQLLRANRHPPAVDARRDDFVVGRSLSMRRLKSLVERVAPTDATVLITGEHGAGKEMVAREIFRMSARRREPFIKVNCAALSETLIESELFGHERGAFTGATEKREGRFELANRGTLLLDEVSEIPANLQAKLLRVLQEREFERVGGSKSIKVNVRIIATSNRDLLRYVEKGDFRADLYYRLNVFPIHVPPLRERPDEIPVLADSFLGESARRSGVRVLGFSPQAKRLLCSYGWPGNVRELHNTVERAVILTENDRPIAAGSLGIDLPGFGPVETEAEALWDQMDPSMTAAVSAREPSRPAAAPANASNGETSMPLQSLAELEKRAILSAMKAKNGNRAEVVELLGISIRTLRNKLQEYRNSGDYAER